MSIIAQFLGFQSSKNQNSSPSRKERALARKNAWSRKDNLIIFHGGYSSGPEPIKEFAHGLASLGYKALLVNAHNAYPDNGRSQTVPVVLKNSPGEIHTWTHQDYQQNFGQCIEEFTELFDYVLVDARHTDKKQKSMLGHMMTRLIVQNEETIAAYWTDAPEIANRAFMIVNHEKPAILYMNDMGVPEGSVHTSYRVYAAVPDEVKIPVIASCHYGLDREEFARAILGTGDPLRVYSTRKHLAIKNAVYTLSYPSEDLAPLFLFFAGAFSFASFAFAGAVGLPLWIGLVIPAIVVTIGGMVPWFRYRFRKGRINSKNAKVKEIYATQNEVNFPVTAPVLGEIISRGAHGEFVPISMVAWKKSEQAYLNVKERWVEYELDVFKMLDAPLLLDYSCAETRTLAEAMKRSEQALEESKIADESIAPRLRREFSETVSALEIAFKVAEDNALRQGISYLDSGGQVKVRRARDLLRVAQNTGASDSEREVSYKQAMKNLKGIIVITDTTQKKILESAGQRKTITS